MKYKWIDKEDGESSIFKDKKAVMSFIAEHNEDMETEYESIEDFNKGEDYYEIKPVN